MVQTESIRSLAKQTTYVVSAYTVLLVFSSYAHEKADLFYALTAYTPILLLFCLSPLVAVFFLSTQSARQGAVVLLGIMPAELIYNLISKFKLSPPSIMQASASLIWKILYQGSFGLALVLDVIGCWLTIKLLREIHRQISINNPTSNL